MQIYNEVQRSLQMLHEVDSVLEHLALFWANSEVSGVLLVFRSIELQPQLMVEMRGFSCSLLTMKIVRVRQQLLELCRISG